MNFDHILLIGYGAPARAEEVIPYLRSMSQGRGISEDRLKSVAQHYEVIGGVSPYHEQVSGFKIRLGKELHSAGIALPVFVAMKNWNPFLKDVLPEIHRKGFRRGLAIPLTPYQSASSGAGYKEGLDSIILPSKAMADLSYQFIEGWCDQALFIEAEAEGIFQVLQTIDPAEWAGTPILFSFHSMPSQCDPASPMSHYAEEVRAASALVAKRLGYPKWAVVYQSRPVSTQGTWLGPEIGEEIQSLAVRGEKQILVVPLGFICDHAEVLYDLDHAVRELTEKMGMKYLRANTVLHHPKITVLFRKLIEKSGL